MKKSKRVWGAALFASLLLAPCSAVHASTEDKYFTNFTISARSFTPVSAPREKSNASSVYAYVTKAGNSVKAQTWACGSTSWNSNLTQDYTGSPTNSVSLDIGYEYEIYNGIYEAGYRFAGLKLQSDNIIRSDVVSGRWSADSIRTSGMIVARH